MIRLNRFDSWRKTGARLAVAWLCVSPLLITSCSIKTTSDRAIALEQRNFTKVPYGTQAKIIKELLQQNRFTQIEQILNDAIQSQLLTRGGSWYAAAVLDRAFTKPDPQLLIALDSWVRQDPRSSLAYAARGYFYYHYAWSFRGNEYTNKTPKKALQKYWKQLTLCAEDIQQALSIDSENPLALLYVLRLGRNTKMSLETFNQYFAKATAMVPFFLQAYQEKSLYLAPNWYGDATSMLNFVNKSVSSAPRGTAIPLLLPQAHNGICNYRRDCQKSQYFKEPKVWQDIETSYLHLIEDFPQSGVYAYWFAKNARKAGKTKIARQYYELALRREPNNKMIKSKADLFR